MSSTTSADSTRPSSLVRTHGPDRSPPSDFVSLYAASLQVATSPCCTTALPDVILDNFPWMLGPLPRELQQCIYPFLPAELRPSPQRDKVGLLTNCRTVISVRTSLLGLQSFLYVQASRFARHPDHSHRRTLSHPEQPCLLLPNTPRFVTSSCPGYASRLNRTIDGRGLSPH